MIRASYRWLVLDLGFRPVRALEGRLRVRVRGFSGGGIKIWLAAATPLVAALGLSVRLPGQASGLTAQPLTVTGRVVNASTGKPIPRALVNLNSRAVLTDALGRFEFPGFSPPPAPMDYLDTLGASGSKPPQAWARVSKPGFTPALDPTEAMQPVNDLRSPVELKLYPDALITGVVTGSDRQPLPRVLLTVFRQIQDGTADRLVPVGNASTDRRGEFRTEQPPGRYRVVTRYSTSGGQTGEVVLPQAFPPDGASATLETFAVGPGEERRLDLRARSGSAYPITFRVETESDRGVNIQIMVRPASGVSFQVFARPAGEPGEFRIDLPSGSYALRAIQQDRERRLEAESAVTVSGKAISGLTLHFAEIPSLPVEVVVENSPGNPGSGEGSSGNAQTAPLSTPGLQNFALRLSKLGAEAGAEPDVRVAGSADRGYAFQAASGTYQLLAQSAGPWYVKSAQYGTSNLLGQSLSVSPGSGGEPIRITVSNAAGRVQGTVRSSGAAARGFVYLLPHEPSITPVFLARAGNDGSYSEAVPPGAYSLVAFDHRFSGDLRSQWTTGRLSGAADVVVSTGGNASLDLSLQTVEPVQ